MKRVNSLLASVKRENKIRAERKKDREIIEAIERMTTEQLKELIELVENGHSDERIREICASVGLIVE